MALEDLVPEDSFRCSLVGPSRVGKTSLVTAVLDEAQEVLRGTPVRVVPADNATKRRITDHRNSMRGAINAREFDAAALQSTGEPQVFNIALDAGESSIETSLRFSILDYPGLWLSDPDLVPAAQQEDWRSSRAFMSESTVLLVPIDAAVLMEATSPEEKAVVPVILDVASVNDVVTAWAKERNQGENRNDPAVLMLCPLKCESYFSDNGGPVNRSNELLERVKDVYGDVIRSAKDEATNRAPIQILYGPVDTYGCVELIRASWPLDGRGDRSFQAHYRLRPPYKAMPKGASTVLQLFCRLLVDGQARLDEVSRAHLQQQSRIYDSELNQSRGLLRRMMFKMSGDKRRLEEARARSKREADRLTDRIAQLNEAMRTLAGSDLDGRASWL